MPPQNRISAIIIDDEQDARKVLISSLQQECPEIDVLGEASTVRDGLELINQVDPEVIFLDIELRGESGFDLIDKCPEINFEIIFTTAFDKYALRAIKVAAIDYLLKPVDPTELKLAIGRLRNQKDNNSVSSSQVELLLQQLKNDQIHKLAIPDLNGITYVDANNIIYLKSAGNYCSIYTEDKKELISTKSLKDYEELMNGMNFIRIHQRYLINLKHVERYDRSLGGTVTMSNGKELEISRRKRHEFLNALK